MDFFSNNGCGVVKTSDEERKWDVVYSCSCRENVAQIRVLARGSDLTVMVSYFGGEYYVSVPNKRAAIPPISDLTDSYWIWEELAEALDNSVDAKSVTAALGAIAKGNVKEDEREDGQAEAVSND